jgi:predicted lysophospholipase L1 biosynthesis ABC-type transport system permease subunit
MGLLGLFLGLSLGLVALIAIVAGVGILYSMNSIQAGFFPSVFAATILFLVGAAMLLFASLHLYDSWKLLRNRSDEHAS